MYSKLYPANDDPIGGYNYASTVGHGSGRTEHSTDLKLRFSWGATRESSAQAVYAFLLRA